MSETEEVSTRKRDFMMQRTWLLRGKINKKQNLRKFEMLDKPNEDQPYLSLWLTKANLKEEENIKKTSHHSNKKDFKNTQSTHECEQLSH